MENPTSEQLDILDKLIGRKIWDIEIIEEEPKFDIEGFVNNLGVDDETKQYIAGYVSGRPPGS